MFWVLTHHLLLIYREGDFTNKSAYDLIDLKVIRRLFVDSSHCTDDKIIVY